MSSSRASEPILLLRRAASLVAWLLLVLALALVPAVSVAQIIPNVPNPLARDTVPAGPDSVAPDSLQDVRLSAAADSIKQILQALPGYIMTEYTGENANFRTDTGVLRLEGQASVNRDGTRLTTDTIVYYQRDQLIETFGDSASVTGEQQNLSGRRLIYDLRTERATAIEARTEVTEGPATWFVMGDMTVEGTNRLFGSHARFTSCDLQIPHYHFETDEIVVIRNQILVARPARFFIGEVPLLWLPFVVQNLEQGRRSGLLTPRFGVNDIVRTSSGYNRQITNVGFYWAINDYMGAEVSTNWRSGAYTSLLGSLNYNWRQQFLSGSVSAERYWQANGGRQLAFNTTSNWQPDERTSVSVSGRYASSGRFVQQTSYDPREVTQDLNSTLNISRRFDWGQVALGGDRRQSISNGDVTLGFPSFSISPRAVTLFQSTSPETARWFNDITMNIGGISGTRSTVDYADNLESGRRDQTVTRFSTSPSLTIGNLSISARADANRATNDAVSGVREDQQIVDLAGFERDEVNWSASVGYRQQLIGSTSISPGVSLNQSILRDTLTADLYISGPTRYSFSASLNTDIFGFYPGFGGLTRIRHRLSPFVSYSYAPEVQQTPAQEAAFGARGGRTQNRVTFGLNQTWEAKLATPNVPEETVAQVDSLTGDTIRQSQVPPVAGDPQKVTILSLTTSSFTYDFAQRKEEGSGFLTDQVSNTIRSDYLRGLSVQMQHELFDRRELAPTPENTGKLGRFAPRLSSLSTSFELGPQSAIFQWLNRIGFGDAERPEEGSPTLLPGPSEDDEPAPAGTGGFTGNNQGTGAGPWSVSLAYQYTRNPRIFISNPLYVDEDDGIQTVRSATSFQLTPKWGVSWSTDYSITDGKFGSHALNFRRDIHEWQANFSFYQTPSGNTAFEFYVQLLHNTDLRFDYGERNLGIDRNR